MKIEQFRMERTQCLYENEVAFNLSESGVSPLSIAELLPERGGYRYANSDPVTGQAAWYDLRVRLERCLPEECGATDPLMVPVKARPRRGLAVGEPLRYGADLKCRELAGDRPGAPAVEWIGNRHEVSLTVTGVADGRGNVTKPGDRR